MTTGMRQVLDVGAMPLYWRIAGSPAEAHPAIPSRYDFRFECAGDRALVRQPASPELSGVLRQVYLEESNVGYLQDGHMLSQGYGEDLLRFILENLSGTPAQTVLEVGCGGCYVLERLAARGFDVTGVDPSPVAIHKGKEKGLRVIPEFYRPGLLPGTFDAIIEADVLEHVPDPVAFLAGQMKNLGDAGAIIIAVPDCTESIRLGDVSMALHQHLNYFSAHTLARTVNDAGLELVAIEAARYGGSLYCCARKRSAAGAPGVMIPAADPAGFIVRSGENLSRFRRLLGELDSKGLETGFYVPLRAAPYLSHRDSLAGYRWFDDTPHWHGKFIDGFGAAIENMQDLLAHPVDELFIMSLTFGRVIESKLRHLGFAGRIRVLGDLLRDAGA